MYDLRILLIWLVLGFLLYLISIRPEKVTSDVVMEPGKPGTGKKKTRDRDLSNDGPDRNIVSRLRETDFVEKYDPFLFDPVTEPGDIIPGRIISDLGVVPLRIEDDILVLAMLDPFDLDAVDIVRYLTGKQIKPVKIRRKEFNEITGKRD